MKEYRDNPEEKYSPSPIPFTCVFVLIFGWIGFVFIGIKVLEYLMVHPILP